MYLAKGLLAAALALSLCVGISAQTAAAQTRYNDFDEITSHVSLKVSSQLKVTRPEEDLSTTASAYFLAGNSDPDKALTINGKPVEGRGTRGTFGVFVQLHEGQNTFVFRQGDRQESVTITQGQSAGTVATTKVISRMAPSYDGATFSGETITLSCVAPSGASVTAEVNGRRIKLKQAAATAQKGVPATFTAKLEAPAVNGTRNLGRVTYTLNGKTDYTSAGSIYIAGERGKLAVQVKNSAAVVYKDAQRSAFIETAKLGGVDYVTDLTGDLYQLSTGGWISKEAVQPLTKSPGSALKTDEAIFGRVTGGQGEVYSFPGEGRPMFRAYQDAEKLYVKLFNTSFSQSAVNQLKGYMEGSELFSSVSVAAQDGDTALTFRLSGERTLWGYDITYGKNGGVNIFAKFKPQLQSGTQPLSGVLIAVDAGHGGSDPGALGIPGTAGATEKEITLATAVAVQKRLESLGATVLMARSDDSDVAITDRQLDTQDADLFISLHCNSIDYARDTGKIGGTEVYYYESRAKGLASALSDAVSSYTGRSNRGAKFSNYRVTLNSYAPSVLVEMGFLTNPAEYDSMTSKNGIFQTANAVGDGVLAFLSGQAV